MRIVLPEWVYRNLEKFGNVALPYSCNDIDRNSLKKHLEKKLGIKIRLKKAIFKDIRMKSETIEKPYLIAEEIR